MSQNGKKLAVMSMIALTLIGSVAVSAKLFIESRSPQEEGQARLTSLSSPSDVKSKTTKEQPVLLNDPAVLNNWGLMGTNGASDIKASKAWQITQGSRDIVVAIIDTGIDIKHEDLKNNLWKNPGETGFDEKGKDRSTNGLDDDKNGFIDDVYGWNFVSETDDLTDNHGHGTHVAGIVGAEGDNGVGISGVSPKVSLMILKYYDPKARSTDNLQNTIRAIQYATKMNAHIINYSGGGLDFSKPEYEAVKAARDKGILFVAAAGNERSNSDKKPYYPANYALDNIVSVTAIDPGAQVLKSSNWGINTVDLAAPGEHIFSTLPNNQYGMMTGTSQATAFVTGVAALIFSNNKEFDYLKVRNQIVSTADELPGMRDKARTSGKLNSWAALAMQPLIPVTGIVASSQPNNQNYQLNTEDSAAVGPGARSSLQELSNILRSAVTNQ
jgi:subtilisin family serine protease